MNLFMKTGLINLFKESIIREVAITEWELSYVAFASEVFAVNTTRNKNKLHNSLCFVKAELAFWQSQIGLKKKCGSLSVC